MTNRWSGAIALGAMALLSACQIFAPAAIQQAATARVQGSVFLPAKQIVVNYRTQDGTSLVEKPGVGAVVRMFTRDGQGLSGLADAKVDASGQFAFQQEVPEGLYLAVATFGATSRVMAFVRVKAGTRTTTILTAASTMVANRLGRTRLKLTALQQPEFDEIATQARAMMTDADVPDLTPEGVSPATDAFLSTHLIVKDRIESLLSRLAKAEGVDDPLATLPVSGTPAPSATPTPTTPDPVYTPVPTPSPTTVDPAGWVSPMQLIATGSTDSTPYWVEMEGTQFLWVSCPASNSIMRFDRAHPNWSYSRPTTNLLRDRFIPGQLAVDETSSPVIWVGNQRSDGTRVARYDVLGNFLGSVDVGPAPAVLGLDTAGSGRRAWIGVTGDDSGKIVVADTTGRIVSAGNVLGKPFRILGCRHYINAIVIDKIWVATSQALYSIPIDEAKNVSLSTTAHKVDLTSLYGEVRGVILDPYGYATVLMQESGNTRATLTKVNPLTLETIPGSTITFDTTAKVVSVVRDYIGRPWVVTENESIRFEGDNWFSYPNQRKTFGICVGRDPAFWSIHEGDPQLLKRAFGP